jgi:hypothetical protein
MIATIKCPLRRHWTAAASSVVWLLVALGLAAPALAFQDTENPVLDRGYDPSGVFVMDGSFVMNVGEVQINITNWGLIGSTYSMTRPWSDAPSCQWPAGSGNEYLWGAGLWVGGVVLGERLVSTGGWGSEIYPVDRIEYTIYESVDGILRRPEGNVEAGGKRRPSPNPDDDGDGLVDEETLNGFDDDGDGEVDEDFGQVGNQMMVLTNFDNTRLAQENFPDHTPMNLEIVQTAFQWENDLVDDFVGFDYNITNVGVTEVVKVYIGFFADSDIGPRGLSGAADDDLAGSWPTQHGSPGLVRASDGQFVPIQVGYMYDASESDPIPGYFGIVFLGHDVDAAGVTAPRRVGMRTFQSFVGSSSFEQGGDPSNDDESYQLLSAALADWDGDTALNKKGDIRFLVSAGPFSVLPPGESLSFQVGMVMGDGLGNEGGGAGLLANCAEAALTYYGIWVDDFITATALDGSVFNPGIGGRETMLCRDDFSPAVFDNFRPDYMDTSCVSLDWVLGTPALTDADLFEVTVNGRSKVCAMFNMDNCFECARQLGHVCTGQDFSEGRWTCNDLEGTNLNACTGVAGNETQIHWLVGMAPPPPGLRLWPTDSGVHVFWDDLSEITPDIRLRKVDFESYRIWRADNWDRPFGSSVLNGPESSTWQMVAEYDLVNTFINSRTVNYVTTLDTLPLGANTGFDGIIYRPRVLDDARFDGLSDAMQAVVDGDPENLLIARPPLRQADGTIDLRYIGLIAWETYPDVLDTFFAVAVREADPGAGVTAKHGTRYYEYVDGDIHNGFQYFYSVTATDHALKPGDDPITLPVGPGLSGDPGSSFEFTVPGATAQTVEERERFGANIYVYPNPATRDALAEFQQLNPNGDDPTGVRVTFTNLPMARNSIKIYTVSGDLVQTLEHNGLTGSGHYSWNLMSRNGQEIVSGVYLYSVESDNASFEDFIGKFVVVR